MKIFGPEGSILGGIQHSNSNLQSKERIMNSKEKAEVIIIVIKRIGKWIFYALGAAILLALVLYGYLTYTSYINNKPKLITGINGIELGHKVSDVLFRNIGFKKSRSNKENSSGEVLYENIETGASFFAVNDIIVEIDQYCKVKSEYTSLNHIICLSSSGDSISEKYGKDLLIQCSTDKNYPYYIEHRNYIASKYGVRHLLFSNKVEAFTVATPERLNSYDPSSWGPCE